MANFGLLTAEIGLPVWATPANFNRFRVLASLSRRMHQTFVAVGSLYNVLSPKMSNNSVRELIWNSFAMSVDLRFTSYYFCVCFYVFNFCIAVLCCILLFCICLAAIWRNNK